MRMQEPKRPSAVHAMLWRGILAIAFGLLAVGAGPGSARGLAFVFGTYAALEALGALAAALALENRALFGIAIVNSLAGGYVLLVAETAPTPLAHVIGAWAMATGILELFASGSLRRGPGVRMEAVGVVSTGPPSGGLTERGPPGSSSDKAGAAESVGCRSDSDC